MQLIERIEVEEGFLDGVVIDFVPGLNVIVGARGTGKTSVIELIRFCLGVPNFTKQAREKSLGHALDVLGSGRVTVTVSSDGQRYSVSRAAGEPEPTLSRPLPLPSVTVLSQKEIETVGLEPEGILRLIDDFNPQSVAASSAEVRCLEQIRSLSGELLTVSLEATDLQESINERAELQRQLEDARNELQRLQASTSGFAEEKKDLEALSSQNVVLTRRMTLVEDGSTKIDKWRDRFSLAFSAAPRLPAWPNDAGPDLLKDAREWLQETSELLATQLRKLEKISGDLLSDRQGIRADQATIGDRARDLRRTLSTASKGIGEASTRISRLEQEAVRLESLKARLSELRTQQGNLQRERGERLDELDDIREEKYRRRVRTCEQLNDALAPRISARVIRYGLQSDYSAQVISALRGTRLHYNELAPILAAALAPRELVEAAEASDVATVVEITGMDFDRIEKALTAIRECGGGDILAAELEDSIELRLLDGTTYKPSKSLSTGQRCTVVLPLLLEQHDRVLVIDQPEDHLDNGFITETVVKALTSRRPDHQMIVASHNANIPVLGEANRVLVLESDGVRARLASGEDLEAPDSVDAITRIMEGGRQAFEQRGLFYRTHPTD